MTERSARNSRRSAGEFRVGPSRVSWDGQAMSVEIDETAVPHLMPVRGIVRIEPEALTAYEAALDSGGHHLWRPFAPLCRITVDLERPKLRWEGHGYFDANFGARPLEADFVHWNWSRSRLTGPAGSRARIFYEADRRDGSHLGLNLLAEPDGSVTELDAPPPESPLPRTLWRVPRKTRSEAPARLVRSLEDAPFYSRAMIETELEGTRTETVHESLDLDRFASRWVRMLLPWRMPRATWWGG